mmetsp:Transcript_20556/g.41139  ORF Transcript_20556/g.41139 Transcript_20556/m.41139 type:complete len:255 (-) Transcript_20556:115-879(-)
MKYLQVPRLAWITSMLSERDFGDRNLQGRVEAFSCKRAGQDKRMAKVLQQQYAEQAAMDPEALTVMSPLGPLSDSSTRRLLVDLISTMNASFQDWEFSNVRPDQFSREENIGAVINRVNSLLAETESGFLEQLWDAINHEIALSECQVFSYVPDMESDPFSEGALWSFNYFFYNRTAKKLLYFTCVATSKFALTQDTEYLDSEAESEDDLANVEQDYAAAADAVDYEYGEPDPAMRAIDDMTLGAFQDEEFTDV